MTRNQNNHRYEGYSVDRSHQNSNDVYNILEPSPDNDFQFQCDEDDELSDFSLMENARDLDYEE